MSELPGDRSRLIEPLRSVKPPPEGVPMLEALVKEGGLEAGTAARLLGEMGSVSSLPVLLQVLNDAEAVARSQVLDAVGVLGDPQGADTVAKYLYSESPHLRAQACRALAKLKSTSQLEALDALKGDYDRSVRESAQAALDALSRTAGTPDGGTR